MVQVRFIGNIVNIFDVSTKFSGCLLMTTVNSRYGPDR